MRTVKMGSQEIGIKATPVALFYYKQEFKSDLIGDLTKMQAVLNDISNLDTVLFLQLIWAMNKAAAGVGKPFLGFESWLNGFAECDITEPDFLINVITEAQDGFFRGAAARAGLAAKAAKPAGKKL